MVDFIMWIVIGVVAGWLAGLITKDDHSIVGDLILGLLGALVAGFVVGQIGPESNSICSASSPPQSAPSCWCCSRTCSSAAAARA
jgi:uncharacterized membrane protein YeaQ/YmgE (transglycosylase-associated protein family)